MSRARSPAVVDAEEALRVAQPPPAVHRGATPATAQTGAAGPHRPHLAGVVWLGCSGHWGFWIWKLFRVSSFDIRISRHACAPTGSAARSMGRMGPMGRMGRAAGGIAVPGGVHVWALPGSMGKGSTGGWGSQEEAPSFEPRARTRKSLKPRRSCELRATSFERGGKKHTGSLKLQAASSRLRPIDLDLVLGLDLLFSAACPASGARRARQCRAPTVRPCAPNSLLTQYALRITIHAPPITRHASRSTHHASSSPSRSPSSHVIRHAS